MGSKILLKNKKQLLEYIYNLIENDFNCKIADLSNGFCLEIENQRFYISIN